MKINKIFLSLLKGINNVFFFSFFQLKLLLFYSFFNIFPFNFIGFEPLNILIEFISREFPHHKKNNTKY